MSTNNDTKNIVELLGSAIHESRNIDPSPALGSIMEKLHLVLELYKAEQKREKSNRDFEEFRALAFRLQAKAEHVERERDLQRRLDKACKRCDELAEHVEPEYIPFDEDHEDYDGKRVHKIIDFDCEICTKYYFQGGCELDFTCTFCGIRFEREPDAIGWCYHCSAWETPGMKEEHERLDVLDAENEEYRLERLAQQAEHEDCYDCDKKAVYCHLADGGKGCEEHSFVCTDCDKRFMEVNKNRPELTVCYGCVHGDN